MGRLRVAQIASEVAPLAKTGGLADVVASLSRELESNGNRISIYMPFYRETRIACKGAARQVRKSIPVHLGPGTTQEVNVFQATLTGNKANVFLIENAKAFDRDHIYGTSESDYADNGERFILFCRAVTQLMKESGDEYDVVHCHDWQTALVPAYIRRIYAGEGKLARMAQVFSIHNLAYQGVFGKEVMLKTGLGWELFTPEQLEYWGKVNFMKAGILYSDKISTVSPTYSKEILGSEYGCGLDGLLRTRQADLSGILNGIDTVVWDPAKDARISAPYSAKGMEGKEACRRALLQECGWENEGGKRKMIIGAVARLASQKGFDILVQAIPKLAKKPVKLVVLGRGERKIQDMLEECAHSYPGLLSVQMKFDEAMAHRIYAGADAFLMPSKFEPCGLGQMIAMRYGTLPIVRATGGLLDSIRPIGKRAGSGNGILFKEATPAGIITAVEEALELFKNEVEWKKIIPDIMGADFSWSASARQYENLYVQAIHAMEKRMKNSR